MKAFLFLFAFASGACAADAGLGAYSSAAQVEAPPAASHYRVAIPAAVYRATQRYDLADLRVANAEKEFVPFAFAPRAAADPKPAETTTLKVFPLYGDEARGLEGLNLRIERSASGTVVQMHADGAPTPAKRKLLGYIAEVPVGARAAQAAVFDWNAAESFAGSVRIEASDDLRRWNTIAVQAPLIQLAHAGERLERKRVELNGVRAKYLRLSFQGVPAGFTLNGLSWETRGERAEPERESLTAPGRQDAEKRDEYVFDLGGIFPVDRVKLELPQANTVAPIQVFSREKPDGAWRAVASTIVYRLNREGGEATSPALPVGVNADRYWLVRVDSRSGGFGSGEAKLVASWVPHEIVFAARGSAPFSVLVGNKAAHGAGLPLSTILPDFQEGAKLSAAPAKLGELRPNTAATPAPVGTVAVAKEFAGSQEGRKWLLWIVLVAGVLFVIWMATRLMKDLGKADAGPKKE